jgi:hypothetical protein
MTLCQLEDKVLVVISQHGVADSVNLVVCYFYRTLNKSFADQSLKDVEVCVILEKQKFEFFEVHHNFVSLVSQ